MGAFDSRVERSPFILEYISFWQN